MSAKAKVTVYLDAELVDALEAQAVREHRSFSGTVEMILSERANHGS